MVEEIDAAEFKKRYRRKPAPPKPPDPAWGLFTRAVCDWSLKHDLDLPTKEHRFARPDREWRFDFAWIPVKTALEYEGGTYVQGRHVQGKGYAEDCRKYSTAAILGWTVIRVTIDMVKDGTALDLITRALLRARERGISEDSEWAPPTPGRPGAPARPTSRRPPTRRSDSSPKTL